MNANDDGHDSDSKKGNGTKRKADDGSAHPRAKRNRYISLACNECKRRKIKCNGESPCARCGNLQLECIYAPNCCSSSFKDSDEYRQITTQLETLQDQVDNLYSNLNALQNRSEGTAPPPPLDRPFARPQSVTPIDSQLSFQGQTTPNPPPSKPTPKHRFSGPTTSAYDFNVATNSLHSMGITQQEYGTEPVDQETRSRESSTPLQTSISPVKDPLWSLDAVEALRLCTIYEEECGMLYPILDIQKTMNKAKTLFTFLDSMKRVGFLKSEIENGDSLDDDETLVLKMILACALTIEGNGESELGKRLFENVRRISNMQDRLGKPATIRGLQILFLTAQYYFHLDQEVQAYRITGLAARQCFELGLHRREMVSQLCNSEDELLWTIRLFWVIYVSDRRWSFGTGMPFAMQDADIDPTLPDPDSSTPFLRAMVAYGRISSKVWTSVAGFENTNTEIRKEEIGFLDYQIKQWLNSIPETLKFRHSDNTGPTDSLSRGMRRIRVVLYLRANQLRIQLYRPVLFSITSILENRGYASTCVEIAKDTIQVLTRLNQISDLYSTQQVSFHYFLILALGVLLLAVAHAPAEFSQNVRDEFYMALDLVKGFSSKSYLSSRLWRTIKGLKEIAPKLGLISGQALAEANDPHSSAAVAMAGLAGHQVQMYPPGQTMPSIGNSPVDGQQMSFELTNLFEVAGGYGVHSRQDGMMVNGMGGGPQGEMVHGGESLSMMMNGNDDDFLRIMKECF